MPFIVGFDRQETIPQKGQIRRIFEVLEEIHYRIQVGRNMPSGTSISTWTTCQARPRKESKIWPKEFGCVLLIKVSI